VAQDVKATVLPSGEIVACVLSPLRGLPSAAMLQDSWAAKLYADARGRGKRHPHATRIVARAWLRIIWACWTTQQPYDPSRHRTSTSSHPPVPPPPAKPAGAQARSRWSTPRLNDLDRAEHRHTIKCGGTPDAINLT
jgi:hypothetical protein